MNRCSLTGAAWGLISCAGLACAQTTFLHDPEPSTLRAPRIPMLPNADTDSNDLRRGPLVPCFAEGADAAYIRAISQQAARVNAALGFGGIDYFTGSRWDGDFGSPVNIRWSFVPDGLMIPAALANEPTSGSVLFAVFDSGFSAQGGRAAWIARVEQSFARWAQLSGNTYARITVGGNDWDDGAEWGIGGSSGLRGDIRIAGHPIDGAVGANVYAYAYYPPDGDVVIDTGNIGTFSASFSQHRALRNTLTHELGHAHGLLHSCSTSGNILMKPFIDTNIDGPQQDDIRGIQSLYGDIHGPKATVAQAKDLGPIAPGDAIPASGVLGTTPLPPVGAADQQSAVLSLDPFNPTDYYKITATTDLALSITATPKGSTYQNAQQNSDGSCPTTGSSLGLAGANLTLSVLAGDGTTVLASSNAGAMTRPETLENVILPAPGVYYVRVGADPFTDVQLYTLGLTATPSSYAPSFTTQPTPAPPYCAGSSITFTIAAAGLPAPSFQWRRDGIDLANGGSISGATSATLTIAPATAADAGLYDCVATNANGDATSSSVAVTLSDLAFTQQPAGQTVPEGSLVTFTVATTPTGSSWQWYVEATPIFLANEPTYSFNAFDGDQGIYTCAVTGPCGVVTSNGATLAFTTNACYANCDGSTGSPSLTASDFVCFLNRFRAGDPYANCDGSTGSPTLTAADFVCYLAAFRAGCS